MTHRWKRFFRVTVLDPGTNYETTPTVTVDNPSAPRLPAVGTASIDSSAGKVSGVVVDSGGTYYDAAPVVTIAAPSGEGTTATGTATIVLEKSQEYRLLIQVLVIRVHQP